jgi:HlyD family secretion protein
MSFAGILATWPGRIGVLALVGVIGGGGIMYARGNTAAPVAAPRTATVTRGSVSQTVTVSGSINPSGQVRLTFRSAGRISDIYVAVGQQISVGQPLAKIDTTDLEAAVTTAQNNLASAQSNYQKQLTAQGDAARSVDQARKNAATDLANAQQALAKLKSNYGAARTNYQTYTGGSFADITSFQNDLATLKTGIENALNELLTSGQAEVKTAQTALYSTFTPMANMAASNVSQLGPALEDYTNARSALLGVLADFDAAIANGSDPTSLSGGYQIAQTSFSLATSRLSSALDTTSSGLSGVQGNVVSAQAALTGPVTKYIGPPYDQWRADLQAQYTLISTQLSRVSAAKLKLSQASTALTTIGDAVNGSYIAAMQNIGTVTDRDAQTIQNAESALASKPADIQSAANSVATAQTNVDTAKTNLDNGTLRATVAGVVQTINGTVGEPASTSTSSPVILVANTGTVQLHGTIGESDVSKLKLGQVANVTVDALTGQKMTGRVVSLDPVATISSGVPVYGIDIAVDVPAASLRAGMSASASVILASKQNVLTVPNTAIRTLSGQRGVQVLKDGEIVDTAATFGLANDTLTEVVSGLAEGDVVVIPTVKATTSSGNPNRGGGVQIQGPGQVFGK